LVQKYPKNLAGETITVLDDPETQHKIRLQCVAALADKIDAALKANMPLD